jgi:hypothetical protein
MNGKSDSTLPASAAGGQDKAIKQPIATLAPDSGHHNDAADKVPEGVAVSVRDRPAAAGRLSLKALAVGTCLASAVLAVVLIVPSCAGQQRREIFGGPRVMAHGSPRLGFRSQQALDRPPLHRSQTRGGAIVLQGEAQS